jgi:hypothetical protein
MSSKYPNDCGSCRFWRSLGQIPQLETGEQFGECRKHPPQIVMAAGVRESAYPNTSELDWCGEWENGVGQ